MKIDGKAIARAMSKSNSDLVNEGHETIREQEEMGAHIKAMASFIEAIHHKDPEAAHSHLNDYMKNKSE